MHSDQELLRDIERYKSFASQDPTNILILMELAAMEERAGRIDEAEARYKECLRLAPQHAVARSRLASVWLSQRRFVEAEAELTALVDTDAPDPVLLHNLGVALQGQQRWQEAAERFSAAYERGLRHPDGLAHWARALHSAGDVEKAVQVGELLLAMAPHSPHKGYVALLYQDFGNKERARSLAHEALQAHPHDAAAHIVVATAALEQQDFTRAREHFEQALKPSNRSARAWMGIGLAHLGQQQLVQAIRALETAAQLWPESPGNHVTLGWAKLLAQDYEAAEHVFRHALEVDRTFGESHGGLAAALALQDKRESAEQAIRVARRLAPGGFGADFAAAVLLANDGASQEASAMIEVMLQRSPGDGMPPFVEMLRRHAALAAPSGSGAAVH